MPGSGLAIQDTSGRFTILHTNDEHSHLIPHPAIDDHPEIRNSAQGGYARLAGAINEIKREKEGIENRSYTSTLGVAGFSKISRGPAVSIFEIFTFSQPFSGRSMMRG